MTWLDRHYNSRSQPCGSGLIIWRASLEARGLGSSSIIIIRMSAIRKLAAEAADNGLLAPELAAGIARVKSAKTHGIRTGNWLSQRRALLPFANGVRVQASDAVTDVSYSSTSRSVRFRMLFST
jgi:hypothetical protein